MQTSNGLKIEIIFIFILNTTVELVLGNRKRAKNEN